MDDHKKSKISPADLPDGLKAIADLSQGEKQALLPAHEAQKRLTAHSEKSAPIALPAHSAQAQQRQRTAKEAELDSLIAKRQEIIEKLKSKNPQVAESRKRVAALIPAVRGRGAPQVMRLMKEADHIDFSIATEAYTPKKEKELIKRLREIKIELSKHKELDSARKAVESERSALHAALSEVKALENELAEARRACDSKYAEVLSERKSAYESRQKKRDERASRQSESQRRRGEAQKRQFEEVRRRDRTEKHKHDEDDMEKYMKDYDDTVSLEEIVQIEKKAKKEKKEEAKSDE